MIKKVFTDEKKTPTLPHQSLDFSKIKVGKKTLEDATLEVGDLKKIDKRLADRANVLKAISENDKDSLREISNFFFNTSGIYSRLCRYLAYMYRYDWYVTPYLNDDSSEKIKDKTLANFYKCVDYLDKSGLKKFFGEAALKVVVDGCYYGYLIDRGDHMAVQDLPAKYCRSRFETEDGRPAVEFNMKFFDDMFKDTQQKIKMLNLFPDEFKKGYILYKEDKLPPEFLGDQSGWYLLDTNNTIKFNLNGKDSPVLITVIPAIIDLDSAQMLDRKRMQQQLYKLVIQQMPIDKNGDLIFDVDEAQALHNNAVNMLGKSIGVDVLTTFADVEIEDMSDDASSQVDELEKVERTVYNEAGISQMQFNTDGNIALEKSILNDEALMYNLIQQFENYLNVLLKPYNKSPKKMQFRAQILATTIYNYKDLSKQYKELTQLGYSKMLPAIALGQSQSSILATAFFENDLLDLVSVLVPPLMSSTMNADTVKTLRGQDPDASSEGGAGRPTNEEKGEAVTEKTMQNKESLS